MRNARIWNRSLKNLPAIVILLSCAVVFFTTLIHSPIKVELFKIGNFKRNGILEQEKGGKNLENDFQPLSKEDIDSNSADSQIQNSQKNEDLSKIHQNADQNQGEKDDNTGPKNMENLSNGSNNKGDASSENDDSQKKIIENLKRHKSRKNEDSCDIGEGFNESSYDFNQTFPDDDFPVDVVYTWVNGSDPVWSEKHDQCSKARRIAVPKRVEKARFVDIGELLFSMRALERYIPWVNHIYLVTDNQVPNWLKKDHPKVTIIDHTQIMPEKYLPTFNSNNIDFHLHLIPNLTEHFIYLNDDVFISRPLIKSHFFLNGRPLMPVAKHDWKTKIKEHRRAIHSSSVSSSVIQQMIINDMGTNQYQHVTAHTVSLFMKKFKTSVCYRTRHGYMPLTISLMKYIWNNFEEELQEVEKHRFRNYNDISMPTMIIQVGIHSRMMYYLHTGYSVRYLVMVGEFSKKLKEFNHLDYNSFCLNSGEKTTSSMRDIVKNYLNSTFCPIKSSFEI